MFLKKILFLVFLFASVSSNAGPWQVAGIVCASMVPGIVIGGALGGTVLRGLTRNQSISTIVFACTGLGINMVLALTTVCVKACHDGVCCCDEQES